MNVLQELLSLAYQIGKKKGENYCHAQKDIGDRVKVWDFSYCEDLETGEHLYCFHEVFKSELIIIEKGCRNVMVDNLTGPQNRDIVVYSPRFDMKIATRMDFVKLAK